MLRPETVIIGRLGSNPEILKSGDVTLCRFSIAVNYSYMKDSELIEGTDWFTLEAWAGKAQLISKHLSKGSLAAFRVQLRDSSYTDQDGKRVYKVSLTVSEVRFLEKNNGKTNEHYTVNDIPFA